MDTMTGTGESGSKPRLALYTSLKRHSLSIIGHFRKLPTRGKLLVFAITLFYGVLVAALIVITPARIAQTFYDVGQKIREHPLGWLLLATYIQIVSFPPMIGHTTMLNLCGFTYGMKGFLVAAPASLVASAVVFIVLRYFFGDGLRSWSERNETWQALEAVINAKGLPLVVLIRLSPFPPWTYSNSLFASIQSVSVWQFMAATICNFPKYLLYVFIGSRMASLSDGKQREHMDTQTIVVNSILIVGGILAAVATGWVLYALMKSHLQEVTHGPASQVTGEDDENVSLLRSVSSESLHESV